MSDETSGATTDQAKGRLKQAAGSLTGDDDLKREGERDETGGKVKDKIDSVKDAAHDAVDSVKDKFGGSKD